MFVGTDIFRNIWKGEAAIASDCTWSIPYTLRRLRALSLEDISFQHGVEWIVLRWLATLSKQLQKSTAGLEWLAEMSHTPLIIW
jgi:hypothetical protein